MLVAPLHKHGLEHFNTWVPGCDTQCTRSVNSASLFIHRERQLRALGYAISFISIQRHFVLRLNPIHFFLFSSVKVESNHFFFFFFYKKWPTRSKPANKKKWRPLKFKNGTFAHNASQHISLESKLALTSAALLCQQHAHAEGARNTKIWLVWID